MAVASKTKQSYKYVEITSLIGHANKLAKQVDNFVQDDKIRYASTVQKISDVCSTLLTTINKLCEHVELDYHVEVVSDNGYKSKNEEIVARDEVYDPYLEQYRALTRAMDAIEEYNRKQVESQSTFIEFFIQLMSKMERDEMKASIPKPKRGPGRPKKVKEGVESPEKADEGLERFDEAVAAAEESSPLTSDIDDDEPNFDVPEETHVSPNRDEKRANIQMLGKYINDRVENRDRETEHLRVTDDDYRDRCEHGKRFLQDDVKIFSKYIARWWDSAILRRRNLNPKFTYAPNMIPSWVAGFAHFAGKTIEQNEKEFKKSHSNSMVDMTFEERWVTFDTRFNEWMNSIKENTDDRWAVPAEVHAIAKGEDDQAYTLTGLAILRNYCDHDYSRDPMIRVELNNLLSRKGFDVLDSNQRIEFSGSDERAKYAVMAENKCKRGQLFHAFPGLGKGLLQQEWKNHKSDYLRLGNLKANKEQSYGRDPMNYKFEDVDNDPSIVRVPKYTLQDFARFDYIMLDTEKPERDYISKFANNR